MLIDLVRPVRGLVAPARGVGAVLGAASAPSARHPVHGELHVLVANCVVQRGGGCDGAILEGLLEGGSKMLAVSSFHIIKLPMH